MTKPLWLTCKATMGICYNTQVENVVVDTSNGEKVAKKLILARDGKHQEIDLSPDDLVYVTNGSIVESSTYGTHHTPAPITHKLGGSWKLWQKLAEQDEAFGHPEVFCENIPERAWFVSATMTMKDATLEPPEPDQAGHPPHRSPADHHRHCLTDAFLHYPRRTDQKEQTCLIALLRHSRQLH